MEGVPRVWVVKEEWKRMALADGEEGESEGRVGDGDGREDVRRDDERPREARPWDGERERDWYSDEGEGGGRLRVAATGVGVDVMVEVLGRARSVEGRLTTWKPRWVMGSRLEAGSAVLPVLEEPSERPFEWPRMVDGVELPRRELSRERGFEILSRLGTSSGVEEKGLRNVGVVGEGEDGRGLHHELDLGEEGEAGAVLGTIPARDDLRRGDDDRSPLSLFPPLPPLACTISSSGGREKLVEGSTISSSKDLGKSSGARGGKDGWGRRGKSSSDEAGDEGAKEERCWDDEAWEVEGWWEEPGVTDRVEEEGWTEK
jgi:hypothetical protein